MADPELQLSEPLGEKHSTVCYMCACRCGINVYLKPGANGEKSVRYIEGNSRSPGQPGRALREGLSWNHAALFTGSP